MHKSISILRDRALMLERARSFFKERGVIEVDCPLLTQMASVDVHIDLIPAIYNGQDTRYLHSSPEYGMKRLLVRGIGDCFQLAHVFRDGEYGKKHNPEFMMAEWYRLNVDFDSFIQDTLEFIRLFLGPLSAECVSYREVFEKYLQINPFAASLEDLLNLLTQYEVDIPSGLKEEGRDAILNLILGVIIEPKLGKDQLTVLQYYPASQAALAKTKSIQGDLVASRFEIYYQGVELCNGYDELACAKEQRMRLEEANQGRVFFGKSSLPIDEFFLEALEKGLPSCCGVAVGFDRLMMLRHKASSLAEVIAFDFATA